MKNYSNQEKEIATIKKRYIPISLSDADCERLAIKAGEVGLTVDELLRNFIGDLVDGTYSNGSDERMYANQWFERTCIFHSSHNTLLIYLLNTYGIGAVKSLIENYEKTHTMQIYIDLTMKIISDDEDIDKKIQPLKEEFKKYVMCVNCFIKDFLEKYPNVDLIQEMATCMKWLVEYTVITDEE